MLADANTDGERCRALRILQGMTIRELAEKLHVYPASLSRFERNQISGISDKARETIVQYVWHSVNKMGGKKISQGLTGPPAANAAKTKVGRP